MRRHYTRNHFRCSCGYKIIVDVDVENNTTYAYCKHCNNSDYTDFKNIKCSTKDMILIASLKYKEIFPECVDKQ